MVPFEIFNESWVLFRDEFGKPACIQDQCAHRACPLSLGKLEGGQVVCAYHGWAFDGKGQCTKMPSTKHCRNVGVVALPCSEKDGFVWIWPGDTAPPEVRVGVGCWLAGGGRQATPCWGREHRAWRRCHGRCACPNCVGRW